MLRKVRGLSAPPPSSPSGCTPWRVPAPPPSPPSFLHWRRPFCVRELSSGCKRRPRGCRRAVLCRVRWQPALCSLLMCCLSVGVERLDRAEDLCVPPPPAECCVSGALAVTWGLCQQLGWMGSALDRCPHHPPSHPAVQLPEGEPALRCKPCSICPLSVLALPTNPVMAAEFHQRWRALPHRAQVGDCAESVSCCALALGESGKTVPCGSWPAGRSSNTCILPNPAAIQLQAFLWGPESPGMSRSTISLCMPKRPTTLQSQVFMGFLRGLTAAARVWRERRNESGGGGRG